MSAGEPFPWIAAALVLTASSGLPGLLLGAGRRLSQRTATVLHVSGCIAGLVSVILGLAGAPSHATLPWPFSGGLIHFRLDALSAFFLAPVFWIAGAGSIFGEGYWPEEHHPQNGRKLRFYYGVLTAGLAFTMIAGDAWSFLAGWEIVGLAAFFLVTTEQENAEARRAGWIYLIATHTSTLILFAMFGLLRTATGSWELTPGFLRDATLITPILVLALIGFGIKAGMMPFHVWLPEAHAAAPSHVSAILSGVVLKMGIYGIVRVLVILPPQLWLGLMLLAAGMISGILGVAFALGQHDLKRLLAYHSIENIGIILLGLGVGILGVVLGHPLWAALGLAGGLLHVWNHALFKSLLFFSAGSVVHTTGTRAIDVMGGLMRRMRGTALAFFIGAVAISGLPPLNGFVSEWLIFLAAFRSALSPAGEAGSAWSLLAAPALALIGALAVACFVKVFSVVFLGHPRSAAAELADEAPGSMLFAMAVLAVVCVAIGLWPTLLQPVLARCVSLLMAGARLPGEAIAQALAPLPMAAAVLIVFLVAIAAIVARLVRGRRMAVTWDCGYAAPESRMQYTASSFADSLVRLFRWALFPSQHRPELKSFFPAGASFETHVPDPVLDRALAPGAARAGRLMAFGRFIQAGRIQIYILYIVLMLVLLLAWSLK